MVFIRGRFDAAELVAGCVGCVALYVAGGNVVPLMYHPDIAAALFVLSSVILTHSFRVWNLAPVKNLWGFVLELLLLYIVTQLMLAYIWESFHGTLDFIRDAVLGTFVGMTVLKDYPKFTLFLRTDVCYMAQLAVAIVVTIKTLRFTRALDYLRPERWDYLYYQGD